MAATEVALAQPDLRRIRAERADLLAEPDLTSGDVDSLRRLPALRPLRKVGPHYAPTGIAQTLKSGAALTDFLANPIFMSSGAGSRVIGQACRPQLVAGNSITSRGPPTLPHVLASASAVRVAFGRTNPILTRHRYPQW